MNYKIKEVSKLAGISTRTLRYYDQIGLLKPSKLATTNYRIYASSDIDLLQQILLYKRLGFDLSQIKHILHSNSFDHEKALIEHKKQLFEEQKRISLIITTIDQTIQQYKGGISMDETQKFNGLKEQKIAENEQQYGNEIRQKYGDETVDASYQKMRKMSKWEFQEAERLSTEILALLGSIYSTSPSSPEAIKLCEMHQKWIQLYWPVYTTEAHMGLVEMYTKDERFTAYYDRVGKGATIFLYNAMKYYLKRDSK